MIQADMIMTENVITIDENSNVEEAAKKLLKKHVGTLLVTKNGIPVASMGKKEIVEAACMKNPKKIKIKQVMSKDFLVVTPETPFGIIEKKMRLENVKRCPVVDKNSLVGIITESDVVNTARDFTKNEQIRQDLTLAVFGVVTALFLFLFSPMGKSFIGM